MSNVPKSTYKSMKLEKIGCLRYPSGPYMKYLNEIENLDCRDNDVWVTSYGKSGSNWTKEMVYLIVNDLNYEKAKEEMDWRFIFIDINLYVDGLREFEMENNLNVVQKFPSMINIVKNTKETRFINTHLPWEALPKQIKDGSKKPKIVHIIRNPKEIVPSFYHHVRNLFPSFIGDIATFTELFMKGDVLYGEYFPIVLSYWTRRNLPHLLIITYEEMIADLRAVIVKVSKFFDKKFSDEQVDGLIRHLGFDEMKRNKFVNKEGIIPNKQFSFMRSGKVDSYKSELPMDVIAKLEEWVAEHSKGHDLPKETIC